MSKRAEISKVIDQTDDEPTQIDRIAEIRGHFRPNKDSSFFPTIQDYVNDVVDLQTTLAKVTKPIDDAITADKSADDAVGDLWTSILHSAKRIPFKDTEKHTKLVDLAKAIKDYPESSSTSGNSIYSTIPTLGMQAREA